MSALKINIVLFGKGNVGKEFINQVIKSHKSFFGKKNIDVRFPIIANSKLAYFEKEGVDEFWESNFALAAMPYKLDDIIGFVESHNLENLIAIDATDSKELVKSYIPLIQNGFNIVAANKNANTLPIDFYNELRRNLEVFEKTFSYEANVSSGFPVIQTLRDLYSSGEKITKIRGIFSDSLSHIFNRFSSEESVFLKVLADAGLKGLNKHDSIEDLYRNDIAKKILILAREIGSDLELSDIKLSTLFPPDANLLSSKEEYKTVEKLIGEPYEIAQKFQDDNYVLRYVAEYAVSENKLEVQLVSQPLSLPIGQQKESEKSFEIYTQSYGKVPIVIQGSGSGKEVLSRGILTDVLKVAEKIKTSEKVFAA